MKKFDFKKLLILLLVLAMSVTVLAACGDKTPPTTPTEPDEPTVPTEPKVTLANKQAEFFDTMFASADQIGKISVNEDGNIYLKLGVAIDLTIGTGSKLPLVIELDAYIDRENVEDAVYVESDLGSYVTLDDGATYVEFDEENDDHADLQKYIKKAEPTTDNTSALNISIVADQVTLLSAYYDVAENEGIVYAIIGGNKVKIDVSDYQDDIDNVIGIVLGFVDGVLENDIVKAISSSFGDDFSLNGLLNSLISQLLGDQDLSAMILDNETIASIVGGLVGGSENLDQYVNATDGVKLADLLKVVGTSEKNGKVSPMLFTTPVWPSENEAYIPINLTPTSPLSILYGGFAWLNGADINLGFTKEANVGENVGKMDSFYIDILFRGLGAEATKKDIAAKISINDLKISNTSEMPTIDTSAYKDAFLEVDASIEIPENFVGVNIGETTLSVGDDATGIPTNITLNLKGGINFADMSKTRVNCEIKAGETVVARAKVFYDDSVADNFGGIVEAEVLDPRYMQLASGIYALIKGADEDAVDYGATQFGWYELNDEGDLEDKVNEQGDYTELNNAFVTFQETGKIRLEGLNLYRLCFPETEKMWKINGVRILKADEILEDLDLGGATADEESTKAFEHELVWGKKDSGIFALIVDLISYTDSDTRTELVIGKDDVMSYIFSDNLFTIKTPKGAASLNTLISDWNLPKDSDVMAKYTKEFVEGQEYTEAECAGFNPDNVNTFFAPQTTKVVGKSDAYTLSVKTVEEVLKAEAEAYWAYTLNKFNTEWISTDSKYTVTEFAVEDIEEADAFITLWADKANNVMTKAGIDIDITYADADIKVTVSATLNPDGADLDWVGNTDSLFDLSEGGEDVGTVGVLTLEYIDIPVEE